MIFNLNDFNFAILQSFKTANLIPGDKLTLTVSSPHIKTLTHIKAKYCQLPFETRMAIDSVNIADLLALNYKEYLEMDISMWFRFLQANEKLNDNVKMELLPYFISEEAMPV